MDCLCQLKCEHSELQSAQLMCHSVQARAMGVYAAHCMSGVQDQASILTNSSSIVPWLSCPIVFFLQPPPLASCAFCLWHAA